MYLEKVTIVTKNSDNKLGMRLLSILNQFKEIHLFFDWITPFPQMLELCNISNLTFMVIVRSKIELYSLNLIRINSKICRRKPAPNLHAWHDSECSSKLVVSHSIWGNKSIFCSCMEPLTHLCTYSTGTEIALPYQYSIIHELMIVFIWLSEPV